MLNAIRHYTSSWVIKILFVLLILSFAVWGIGDVVSGRIASSGVAQVGDVEISSESVRTAFNREYENLRSLLGGAIDRDRAIAMGLPRSALNTLINDTLVIEEAASLGLVATDDMVRNEVHSADVFNNALGTFDPDVYRQVLIRSGLSEAEYLRSVRNALVRAQYTNSLTAAVQAPTAVTDPLYRYRFERRVAETVFVSFASARSNTTPDATTLEAFYAERKDRFMTPEYRGFSAIVLTVDTLAKGIAISEEELKEAFASRAQEFSVPERRTVRQMVFSDRAQAEKAAAALAAGTDFESVAQDIAGMAPETLDLGTVTKDELLPELAEPAFSLEAGAVSSLVQSPLGWHILSVGEIQPATQKTLAEVREQLQQDLAHEAALDRVFDIANRLEDTLASGATLEEASSALELPLVQVAALDATGRQPSGDALADLPGGTQLLDVVFQTREGEDSPLVELASDGYFIVHVNKVTAPAARPLADVQAAVIDDWRTEQARTTARERAEAIMKRIESGMAPTEAAAEAGAAHNTTEPFTREGDGTDLPAELTSKMFAAKPDDVALSEGPNGVHVARLARVVPVDPAADKQNRERLQAAIAEQMQNDVLVVTLDALRSKHDVTINEPVLRELFSATPQ